MPEVFFPKKSHHGYFDKALQQHFYDKKQKEQFMKEHGLKEAGPASKAHLKRVKDFCKWTVDEKKKNPNFNPRNEKYPDY